MEKTENGNIIQLHEYCRRLEEIVAKRSAEFTLINGMLNTESHRRRAIEDGLSLRTVILDNAEEAVFLINRLGEFVYANETATILYGYSRTELLRMQSYELGEAVPDAKSRELQRLAQVFNQGKMELETFHKHKDGSSASRTRKIQSGKDQPRRQHRLECKRYYSRTEVMEFT